jgi:hypothetical protein
MNKKERWSVAKICCRVGWLDGLKQIIEMGINLDAYGGKLFEVAMDNEKYEICDFLLERGLCANDYIFSRLIRKTKRTEESVLLDLVKRCLVSNGADELIVMDWYPDNIKQLMKRYKKIKNYKENYGRN